jgi:hypothetical protein
MSKLYVDEIAAKTTGGIITVNSSVVSTERPSFFATSTGTGYAALSANDTFAGGDWWNDVHHNTGSHFNATTGIFTAPVDGVYFFSFSVLNDGAQSFAILLNKNGSILTRNYIESGRALNFACSFYLQANDEIKIVANDADNYRLGSNYTWFSGCLIG